MPRLKTRQRPVPGGFQYYEPITKWKAPRHLTFDALTQAVIAHRRGNSTLASRSTDPIQVANEVDEFNALYAQRMGWTEFVQAAAASDVKKKPERRMGERAKAAGEVAQIKLVARGAVTLAQLFGPSQKPVSPPLAEKRAAVCATCRENDKGDWKRFFTQPATTMIRSMFGFLHDAKLATSKDHQLGICKVCECPLKLKVWAEMDFIREHTDKEIIEALPAWCWIKNKDNE